MVGEREGEEGEVGTGQSQGDLGGHGVQVGADHPVVDREEQGGNAQVRGEVLVGVEDDAELGGGGV